MITEEKREIAINTICPQLYGNKQQATILVDTFIELFKEEKPPLQEIETSHLSICVCSWEGTLTYFGIDRPSLPYEHMTISRLIREYDYKSVAYALTGMRYEAKTPTFNPKDYIAIRRLDDPKLFERFVNLASQRKTSQDKANGMAKAQIIEVQERAY